MLPKNADLHIHTYYSDGEDSPKEIVVKAKKVGLKYLAITDHNTVKGIDEAVSVAKKLDVVIIPGVEIATRDIEILGYFIDYKNPIFKKRLKEAGYNWMSQQKEKYYNLESKVLVSLIENLLLYFPLLKVTIIWAI